MVRIRKFDGIPVDCSLRLFRKPLRTDPCFGPNVATIDRTKNLAVTMARLI